MSSECEEWKMCQHTYDGLKPRASYFTYVNIIHYKVDWAAVL